MNFNPGFNIYQNTFPFPIPFIQREFGTCHCTSASSAFAGTRQSLVTKFRSPLPRVSLQLASVRNVFNHSRQLAKVLNNISRVLPQAEAYIPPSVSLSLKATSLLLRICWRFQGDRRWGEERGGAGRCLRMQLDERVRPSISPYTRFPYLLISELRVTGVYRSVSQLS